MDPIYSREFPIETVYVDRFGRLKSSMILYFAQEVATDHCKSLGCDWDAMAEKGLFWAVMRHRIQITRLPMVGERVRIETWPMPTSRTSYPRSMAAYDENGVLLFRVHSLWVLMDVNTRAMVLPGKSGVDVNGILRGTELPTPAGLIPREMEQTTTRTVCCSDLDRNGHMNNCRCMDWIADLLPSAFHGEKQLKEFTVCYLNEAREGQTLQLNWDLTDGPMLAVDSLREDPAASTGHSRVFSVRMLF